MKTIICAILSFVLVSFNSLSWAAEIDVALPKDAVKTLEKSFNIGPAQSSMEAYETSLSQDRLTAFYKKEMVKAGWKEVSKGLFSKDNYTAVLAIAPAKTRDNKTQFSMITSRIPTKEEILAQRKANPDKLNFMPVYPGSEQVFLWDMPYGISASYETESDIKDVVFFYKSGMLNYGWSLATETPLSTTAVSNCPECQKALGKLPKEAAKAAGIQGTSSKVSLIFRKANGESCMIRFYQNSITGGLGNVPKETQELGNEALSSSANKTTILVTYNANRKINP